MFRLWCSLGIGVVSSWCCRGEFSRNARSALTGPFASLSLYLWPFSLEAPFIIGVIDCYKRP